MQTQTSQRLSKSCVRSDALSRMGWCGFPVGEEQAEADGLEDASERTDGDGVEGTLLGKDLRDELQKYSISHMAK